MRDNLKPGLTQMIAATKIEMDRRCDAPHTGPGLIRRTCCEPLRARFLLLYNFARSATSEIWADCVAKVCRQRSLGRADFLQFRAECALRPPIEGRRIGTHA